MPAVPRFVCLGAQKAGTQWLYDQVASHPDAWMPPVKELRFLEGSRWHLARENGRRRLNVLLRDHWRGAEADRRDLEFLRRLHFETTDEDAGDLAVYRRLFGAARGAVTGDVSPQYATIDEQRAGELLEQLPGTRFVFLVREPVSRVWSQVCMHHRWSVTPRSPGAPPWPFPDVPPDVVTDAASLATYLDERVVVDNSFQSRVVDRWSGLAGDRFAAFLMDDLVGSPEEFRRRVLAHIGLDGDRCTLQADYNKKAGRSTYPFPPELRRVIEDFLGAEPTLLRKQVADGRVQRIPGAPGVGWLD